MKKINTTSIKRTLALDSYTDRDRDLLIDRIIPKFMKTFEKELKGRDFPARNMPVLFMNEVDSLRGALSESNSETVSQGEVPKRVGNLLGYYDKGYVPELRPLLEQLPEKLLLLGKKYKKLGKKFDFE